MLNHLPRRHRLTLAVVLFLVAVVAGTWTSTLVGDDHPEVWGVAAGLLTGAALALLVLSPGREEAPARR
jgi:hypothetical protein